ncbi:MAG: Stp1/IreP family PP2C-type Ser/Thr phosphatase [Defluviitaleaceae bacterium]|nr:Stp1/IreP family PP2C-type Ser/Thr phosphatase [Defluviitaleaceae bacterium]
MSDKQLLAAGATHVGQMRKENQDSLMVNVTGFATLPNLFIVADGLGGHNAGSIASIGAIQSFCDFLDGVGGLMSYSDLMADALNHANTQINNKATTNAEYTGMGTTFTSATVVDGFLYFAHVGDSRIYVIKNEIMEQITTDHSSSVVEMVADGLVTEAEARNYPEKVLTRAVGTDFTVEVDKGKLDLTDVTHILLCSDGLTNMVFENNILEIIKTNTDPENIAKQLIDAANTAGGTDNITAIVIKL